MPTRLYPVTSNHQSIWVTIEMQRRDGSSPNRRSPDNTETIITPVKVLRPDLCSRIKERVLNTSVGIRARDFGRFVSITKGARQPQILFGVRTPFDKRDDVFNFQARHDQSLWTKTCQSSHIQNINAPPDSTALPFSARKC